MCADRASATDALARPYFLTCFIGPEIASCDFWELYQSHSLTPYWLNQRLGCNRGMKPPVVTHMFTAFVMAVLELYLQSHQMASLVRHSQQIFMVKPEDSNGWGSTYWPHCSAAEARESQAEVVILKRKLEDRSRIGTPRMGSPAPGNSPRLAASGQGSPLRGMPSQGAFSSPQGSPNASAAFSPGSLAAASESPGSYSVASPAQSSPERAYSSQMGQGREADNAMQQEEEQAGQMLQVRCRFDCVDSKDGFSGSRMLA